MMGAPVYRLPFTLHAILMKPPHSSGVEKPMAATETARAEESLDPEDWDELRALGHRMVDDLLDYLRTVRERPVWRPIPPELRARFRVPVPRAPEGAERAYQDFREHVLPHPMGNIHPRFWGWVIGTGTPLGA